MEKSMNRLIQTFGIHPLVALGMICVDMMLFVSDATDGALGTIGTIKGMITTNSRENNESE